MKFDRYELFARIFPATISSLPFYFFYHFFINTEFSEWVKSTFEIKLAGSITMFIVLLFFFYQINRLIGKVIESLLFRGEMDFPTTEFLLLKNREYSKFYKEKLRKTIKKDFGIQLLDQKEESKSETEAKKLIIESVRQIRHKVKGGRLILNRNIEYGFFRNLVAGGIIALPVSIFCAYFFSRIFPSPLALRIETMSALIFFVIILVSFPLLKFLGKNYANSLFQEYLGRSF